MPELPEVETIVVELNKSIIGKTIAHIEEYRKNTIYADESLDLGKLGAINEISRRGKYIIIATDRNCDLIIHLRMTGKLILADLTDPSAKHTRAIITFADKTKLMFDDVRTFGTIHILNRDNRHEILCRLGCEPLSPDFNYGTLKQLLERRKSSIKSFLLDQRAVAGLGNIYVNEILFACGISPHRAANTITEKEIRLLVTKTRQILKIALEHNGTSISDYRRIDNKTGSFQNFLKIYGKDKCLCGHQVKRTKSSGRSTFHCPKCQKEKEV